MSSREIICSESRKTLQSYKRGTPYFLRLVFFLGGGFICNAINSDNCQVLFRTFIFLFVGNCDLETSSCYFRSDLSKVALNIPDNLGMGCIAEDWKLKTFIVGHLIFPQQPFCCLFRHIFQLRKLNGLAILSSSMKYVHSI